MAKDQTLYLTKLRNQIIQSFDLEELRSLAFDLGLDWDELQGARKSSRVEDLIIQLARNDRLNELVILLRKKRPRQTWKEPPRVLGISALKEQTGTQNSMASTKAFWEQSWFVAIAAIVTLAAGIAGFFADSGLRDWLFPKQAEQSTVNNEPLNATMIPEATPLQIAPPGPTATPNAYAVQVTDLYTSSEILNKGISVEETKVNVVNLDGIGPSEIVVSPIQVEYGDGDRGVEVFAHTGQDWERILSLYSITDGCGEPPEHGIVNLLKNDTRQLAVWTQCGSGAYVTLELYEYDGLNFMNRFYVNTDKPDPNYHWLESVPEVTANGDLYVFHSFGLLKYTWNGEDLIGSPTDIIPGSNGITIEYWFDGETYQVSQGQATLRVGEDLFIKQRENVGRYPESIRLGYIPNGVIELRNPGLFRAAQPGTTEISLIQFGQLLVSVTVIEP